jgi:rhamnosyltransferase subunit B
MMFVLSTFGSAGDVFPMLGLATELRGRGHDVMLATNAHFADLVTRAGVAFRPLGSAADFEAGIRSPDLWHPRRSFAHVFGFLRPVLREQYEIHAALASRRDVIAVTNCFGFGALLAQERLGVPVLTLHLQPAVIWSRVEPPTLPGLPGPRWLRNALYDLGERLVIDPVTCPFLNAWRAELGLTPMRRTTRWWHSPSGVVCCFPSWYAPPRPDWPAPLVQTDFPLWNPGSKAAIDPEVARFLEAGSPPLVFTPGSANVHGRGFFAAALDACRRLGRRGVLLTGFPEQVPAPLPAHVFHARYVPLDDLLPRAAAFVHHGGIGSTSQAMLAGVPQVIVPLAHDQFDNATRVRRLGLGAGVPSGRLTGARLAEALEPLLASASVAAACRDVALRLAPRDGLCRTADALEAWASRPRAR